MRGQIVRMTKVVRLGQHRLASVLRLVEAKPLRVSRPAYVVGRP